MKVIGVPDVNRPNGSRASTNLGGSDNGGGGIADWGLWIGDWELKNAVIAVRTFERRVIALLPKVGSTIARSWELVGPLAAGF